MLPMNKVDLAAVHYCFFFTSQWLRYWKSRLSVSLMLHKQERGRGKQVTAIHVRDPSKDTVESKIAQ